MKRQGFFVCIIIAIVISPTCISWQNGHYFTMLKHKDVSTLWHDKLLRMEGSGVTTSFPDPLGYIGNDYQRFKIHYTSVKNDLDHPYQYLVTGKTMVKNMICRFTGKITITQADLLSGAFAIKHKQGELTADVYLKEDAKQKGSGDIHGKLKTFWHVDSEGNIVYDTINCVSDNYSNNQVIGTWIGNENKEVKKCNWGDFRIPQSGDLDVGAGEFSVNSKYINNGWQNFTSYENSKAQSWWK